MAATNYRGSLLALGASSLTCRMVPCRVFEVSMRRNTVLLADDHAIVREGLVSLLKEHHFDVVGAVGDGLLLIDARSGFVPM